MLPDELLDELLELEELLDELDDELLELDELVVSAGADLFLLPPLPQATRLTQAKVKSECLIKFIHLLPKKSHFRQA